MRTIPFRLKAAAPAVKTRTLSIRGIGGTRDFLRLTAWVGGGFCLGYFVFWKPLLAPLGY